MAQAPNNEADLKEIANAHAMWGVFTSLMKYSIFAVAAVLLLMLVFIY